MPFKNGCYKFWAGRSYSNFREKNEFFVYGDHKLTAKAQMRV